MMLPDAGPPWPGSSTVTMLDIGQGDAILLRSPDGAAALIDTGVDGSPARVVGHLKHLGVRRLDLLALAWEAEEAAQQLEAGGRVGHLRANLRQAGAMSCRPQWSRCAIASSLRKRAS